MIKPIHLKKRIKGDYRMIVVSDIHGHLDRFKSLLQKVKYTPEDYLVIIGDFVEKGDQVIETIHYIQQLKQNKRTFVLAGNCEWALDAMLTIPELAHHIPQYLKRVSSNGSIREAYHQLHLDDGSETMLGKQKKIAEYLKEEIDFVSHLPLTLKINQFLFVHAGIEKRKDYENSSLSSMLEMKDFYEQGHLLDEYVVVGHLPTSNHYQKQICNDVIIDKEKKIICVDGGTGVKNISQLNALIIESHHGEMTYTQESVQPLPIYTVQEDVIQEKNEHHKISYPYFEVHLKEKGPQFSLCYQVETDQLLNIKNEFLYQRHGQLYCLDDYIDTMLSVSKGDQVKVIGIYDDYAYVIHNKQVGWIKNKNLCINMS